MHGPIKVKSPNNINKWQMGFNSAFKGLIEVHCFCVSWNESAPQSLLYYASRNHLHFTIKATFAPHMFSEISSQFCFQYLWCLWIQISVLLWNGSDVRDSDVLDVSSVPNKHAYHNPTESIYCSLQLSFIQCVAISQWQFPHKNMKLPPRFSFRLQT
jgi:hypothetical protein